MGSESFCRFFIKGIDIKRKLRYSTNMDNDDKQLKFKVFLHGHKSDVRQLLSKVISDLLARAEHHDDTKMETPEVEVFADNFEKLGEVEYGSTAYEELLKKVKPAVKHHYSKNRHHPEFWKRGIRDMTLIDLIELLCDWQSSTKRNKDGNIRHSLELNAKKYKMTGQLRQILENTIRELFGDE